jgi:AMP-binding enzyme
MMWSANVAPHVRNVRSHVRTATAAVAPLVILGYYRNAQATRAAIEPDGWMHTGDVATRDDEGHYFIVDRKKDLIIMGGFNVYPAEIERVIASRLRRGLRFPPACGDLGKVLTSTGRASTWGGLDRRPGVPARDYGCEVHQYLGWPGPQTRVHGRDDTGAMRPLEARP